MLESTTTKSQKNLTLRILWWLPKKRQRMWGIVSENLSSKLPPPPSYHHLSPWRTCFGRLQWGGDRTNKRGWMSTQEATLTICAPYMLIDQLMLRTNFLVENGEKLWTKSNGNSTVRTAWVWIRTLLLRPSASFLSLVMGVISQLWGLQNGCIHRATIPMVDSRW